MRPVGVVVGVAVAIVALIGWFAKGGSKSTPWPEQGGFEQQA